jgi:hypothetical protein
MENHMAYFHVTDPAINASHGSVWADSPTHAKDRVVSKFGWTSYSKYTAAAAKHSGTPTLEAEEIKVWNQ